LSNQQIYLSRPLLGDEEVEAVKKVLESKYLTEGAQTREFEKRFAEYVGVRHGIATTSCTTGIEVALRAANIGPGDEVIVPDFTFPATALAVMGLGATPVLTDISPSRFVLDVEHIESAVTEKTKCILCVSNLGFPLDYEPIMELAKEHEITVIEDAACSTGTIYNGRKVGSTIDAAVFSFHARKVMTTGEGGMVCTDDDDFAQRCREVKNFGVTKTEMGRQTFERWGTNMKMSNIAAAIGIVQLGRLEKIIEERSKRAETYDSMLQGTSGLELIHLTDNIRYNYYCYPLLIGSEPRDRILKSLRQTGIESQIWSYALHRQPYFRSLCGEDKSSDQLFPNATRAFECGLQLPLHHELTLEQQQYVCNTLLDLLE